MSISYRKRVLFVFLTFISFWPLMAQTFSGRIVAVPGGEPVPFANIMVKGTTNGVASDVDGNFAITVPSTQKTGHIIISAVGYANKEMPVNDLSTKKVNVITISTQEYHIDEVDVEAESKVLYGAVKRCSRNIPQNYINEPYTCDFTYSSQGKSVKGQISDKSAYQRSSFQESFREINYSFNDEEATTRALAYFGGKTNMEDLLSFDLMRTVGNIIDEKNVYDYELSLVPQEDDALWLIHFKAKDPQLYNTGEAHIKTYEGELYVLKDNFVITKIVVRGEADKRSIHGRSIAVGPNSQNYYTNISYEVQTSYTLDEGRYRLDKVVMNESYTDSKGQVQKLKSALHIDKQQAKYRAIEGRDYYVKSL